ncbi:MAG: cytochrome c [Candidatus Tumulicola sp.]
MSKPRAGALMKVARLSSLPLVFAALLLAAIALGRGGDVAPAATSDPQIARGRYLVAFGSCNDCHTPGWRESGGTLPDAKWMTGARVGYRGPWGTVYPPNVRLLFSEMSEQAWIFSTQTRGGRPPMIWHDVRFLTVDDRRAIYAFVRSLGRAGDLAPDDVPPGREPKTPYYWVVPETPAPNHP